MAYLRPAICVVGASWRSTACLCACHFGADCDDVVCSASSSGPASPPPLLVRPVTTARASAHRTSAREQQSYGIHTPLGLTTRFTVPF